MSPRMVWEGTLAVGGRTTEEFHASIVLDEMGKAHVVRKCGVASTEVSPHQIRAEYWLDALVRSCGPTTLTARFERRAQRIRLQRYKDDLLDWRESDGRLVPTEPDEMARRITRAELRGAIFELTWALDGEQAARTWEASERMK